MENFMFVKNFISFNNDNLYVENKELNKELQFYDFFCVNLRYVYKNKKWYIFLK